MNLSGRQPIETAPKDGTEVVLVSSSGQAVIGWWSSEDRQWYQPISPRVGVPVPDGWATHWIMRT